MQSEIPSLLRTGMFLFLFLVSGCTEPATRAALETDSIALASESRRRLDSAFRIDLSHIDVAYDLDPEAETLAGRAELTFRMRPGQTRPLFHFDPPVVTGTARGALTSLRLNGQPIDPEDAQQLIHRRFAGSLERAFEINRELDPDTDHRLVVEWRLDGWREASNDSDNGEEGWFRCDVDDVPDNGNESMWPTINSPDELARHTLRMRVHSPEPYRVFGSGVVTQPTASQPADPAAPIQVFEVDSGREIASYTMLFAAMPAADVVVEQFEASGVPVTIVSTLPSEDRAIARADTEESLARLARDFGPFPMPFMNILLLDWDDGMEYYGGTITGLDAVAHELVHMYWGCSAVAKTWRDSWFDEALTVWWLERDDLDPLPANFTSDLISSRSIIEPGFDDRAYDEGASLIAETAAAVGGDVIRILADLHARRAFQPFTTEEFVDDLVAASGRDDLRARYQEWLYAR